MIKILRCSEVPSKLLYDTFTEGFSDYIIQMSLTEEGFFNYFFGREGNQLEHSFIAIDTAPLEGQGDGDGLSDGPGVGLSDGLGVGLGVALGGIRIYDGVKTLRCGGFCVVPQWRGSAVASELLQHHMAEAKAQQCGQLYLEVIDKNERAQRFYLKHGYTFGKTLRYYQKDISAKNGASADNAQAPRIKAISFEVLKDFRERLPELHINWQNEMASLEKLKGSHWGLYLGDQLIGALSQYMSAIQFIALLEPYRGQGFGRRLMAHAISQAAPAQSTVRCSFADNPSYEGFLKHLGFAADQLSQLEMYYPL